MKKFFGLLLMPAMLFAMGASVVSCGNSNEGWDNMVIELRVKKYIIGYKWYMDGKTQTEYRFYRNHLVTSRSGFGHIAPGMLTWAESNFFGTWTFADGKLVTTFTSGAYGGFDWNKILYGSLQITELCTNHKTIKATSPNGDQHELSSYTINYTNNDFVDYTDESDHDGALVGTWQATAYKGEQGVAFTVTIEKQGETTFSAPSENINFTTICTTKNGHVVFDHLFTPESGAYSFIYIREKNNLIFYNPKNAQSLWTWKKIK